MAVESSEHASKRDSKQTLDNELQAREESATQIAELFAGRAFCMLQPTAAGPSPSGTAVEDGHWEFAWHQQNRDFTTILDQSAAV